jgi:NhaP-type Na+/H+ or K+/H+ antiporter
MEAASALETVSIAMVAGVGAQLLAERAAIPSIVPLLAIGTAIGPEALGWIDPRSLGDGLETLVGFSVAVILFEGGLRLEWQELRAQGRLILQLVTVGALVTMFAAAAFAWWLLPLDGWSALLLGSLVVVTGPTVIGPLLKRVRLVRRVALVLESEGVLIDPIGAILSFVVLELMLSGEMTMAGGPGSVLLRLTTGILVGAGSGAFLAVVLRKRWTSEVELANLFVLGCVVATFVIGNRLASDAGLGAVVITGIVLGNVTIPGRRELVAFKGALATLVISLLFVLLSANIRWGVLAEVGWRGAAWVAALLLVVRPLSVLAATVGTHTPRADKLLLAWICPRGIVAASIASLFAIVLRNEGAAQAELLQALVFLTIAVTVVVQGLTASRWAAFLGLSAQSLGIVVVGAGPTGRALGGLLTQLGREVALIDSDARHCARARREGLAALAGNCLDVANLERIGLRAADTLLAVTPNGNVNYLVARLALEDFSVARAVAMVTEGEHPVDPTTRESHRIEVAFGRAVPESVHGAMSNERRLWRATASASADLAALGDGLPLVRIRDGRAEVCGDQTTVAAGDRLIFLGRPRGDWLTDVEAWVS